MMTFKRSCLVAACLLAVLCLTQQGCINALVMAGKVMLGDSMQTSAFEQATGTNLKKSEKKILLHCSSPSFVSERFGSLNADIQEELIRRMKRNGVHVLPPDVASKVLDRHGGKFDPKLLVREIKEPIDYVMHIEIEEFSYETPESPELYHGHASGKVVGFEVRGEGETRHVVQIFSQNFSVTYPTTYPIPKDKTPERVFFRRFVDRVTDTLGTSFYDVRTSELYAN